MHFRGRRQRACSPARAGEEHERGAAFGRAGSRRRHGSQRSSRCRPVRWRITAATCWALEPARPRPQRGAGARQHRCHGRLGAARRRGRRPSTGFAQSPGTAWGALVALEAAGPRRPHGSRRWRCSASCRRCASIPICSRRARAGSHSTVELMTSWSLSARGRSSARNPAPRAVGSAAARLRLLERAEPASLAAGPRGRATPIARAGAAAAQIPLPERCCCSAARIA